MVREDEEKKKIWERYFGHLRVVDYDNPLTCHDCWSLVDQRHGWDHIKWHDKLFDDINDLQR